MQDCGESAFLLKCGFLLLAFVLFIYKALFYFSRKVTTTSVFFCFLLLLILAFIYTFPQVLVMSDWLLTSEILNIALIVIKKAPTISDLVFGDPAPPDKDFWWFLLNAAIALLVAGAISLVLTPPSRKGRKRAGK